MTRSIRTIVTQLSVLPRRYPRPSSTAGRKSSRAGSRLRTTTERERVRYGSRLDAALGWDHSTSLVTTTCYSTHRQNSLDTPSKPLPKTPDIPLEKVSIPRAIRGTRFADAAALTPLEQQLLQCLRWLDRPSPTPNNVLVKLGSEAFWMTERDANMLSRMEMLTETMSTRQKDEMQRSLETELSPQQRYPLKLVLRFGVTILHKRSEGSGTESARDSRSYSSEGVSRARAAEDELRNSLLPEPLRIRKSARALFEEPGSSIQHGRIVERKLSAIEEEMAQSTYQSTVIDDEKKPGSVRNALNNLYTQPRRAPFPPVYATGSPNLAVATTGQPGSVRAARLAAEKALGHSVGSLLPENCVLNKNMIPKREAKKTADANYACDVDEMVVHGSTETRRRFPVRLASLPQLPLLPREINGKSL